jgi:prepilin-type N-terminal cleavage/methylation domain-containing protein
MKFPISNCQFPIARRADKSALARPGQIGNRQSAIGNVGGFTLIEIAICLAIIGFALVAIIGVLPLGMNTQRDNREETVINQDATVLVEAIRNAARGADYLTNYVYAIVNTGNNTGYYNPSLASAMNFVPANAYPSIPANNWYATLTNAYNIVGLLSAPQYVDNAGNPATVVTYFASNHIVAYVRSLSGLAAEQPPQDNSIMVGDTFNYRVYCVNATAAFDTNNALAGFAKQLNGNLHELRLTFLWPQLPNGNIGNGKQTFRTSVAGQLTQTFSGSGLYFYQPQFFTNAP